MELFIEYIAPSTNAMYSGQHWTKRVKCKSDTLMAVIAALNGSTQSFINPVRITVLPHLAKGKKSYDVSNYSYAYKLIEDCLVGRKVLQNDTPEFVKEVRFLSPVRSDKTGIKLTISDY